MTLVDFFKLANPNVQVSRARILDLDRQMQSAFFAQFPGSKLINSGGLTLFPLGFLEDHELAAA